MAGQRTTFAKIQRERAKQAKQEAKRAAKHGNTLGMAPQETEEEPKRSLSSTELLESEEPLNPDQLLEAAQLLAERHQAGLIDDDEMDEMRQALIERAG